MTHEDEEVTEVDVSGQQWGSDFIADLFKELDLDFISFNPGSSFRGIEESVINYNDVEPDVLETPHECLAVSMAHGYAKATGEPGVCCLHNVVGTLHGSMGIFNAYCDRVPLLVLSGTGPMRKSQRRPYYDWFHTALVQGNIVRDFVKWDDQPMNIDGTAHSLLRGHKIANTKPKGPTYVALDVGIQEAKLDEPMEMPNIEKFQPPSPMSADSDAIDEAAELLVDADFPVIIADQVGDSKEAVDALVELSETLSIPFFHSHRTGAPHRYNFPNTHPMDLSGTKAYHEADVVLALDVWSLDYLLKDVDSVTRETTEVIDGEFDLIDIGMHDTQTSSFVPDHFAMRETDVPILADTKSAIPQLLDAVTEKISSADRERIDDRYQRVSEQHRDREERWTNEVEEHYDDTPIALPRLASEIWNVISDEEWVLVNGTLRGQAYKQWDIDEFDKYIGSYSGAGGIGYGIGAAIGGALAYSDTDRIPINLQPDGDLMFYPGGLWTIGHYGIPMFSVVHNNRTLFSSTDHRMKLAEHRGRDDSFERAMIGTGLWDPTPDYAEMAESMGVNGYGPVEDPDELAPTLQAAWEDVKNGEPVLVDVLCQPR